MKITMLAKPMLTSRTSISDKDSSPGFSQFLHDFYGGYLRNNPRTFLGLISVVCVLWFVGFAQWLDADIAHTLVVPFALSVIATLALMVATFVILSTYAALAIMIDMVRNP